MRGGGETAKVEVVVLAVREVNSVHGFARFYIFKRERAVDGGGLG